MGSLYIIILLNIILIGYGIIEYLLHQQYLSSIPFRIHVNGTRGKSSVTRLIGAGLRAGGFRTITKVTGTNPRMILNDGTEVAVFRNEKSNILEQLKIIRYCSKENAEVLVLECMALQPIYQHITEHQMVKATHGVITNIRLDHLEVMGPRLEHVAEAISQTIPKKAILFTAEKRMADFLQKKARKLDTKVIISNEDSITVDDMEGFTYFEHPENVILALEVCSSFNIDKDIALRAMKKAIPDEGALKKITLSINLCTVHFYNALAANDPESSGMLWEKIQGIEGRDKKYLIILNSRKDRNQRSRHLIRAISNYSFDYLILTGENIELVKLMGLKAGIPNKKIILAGLKEPGKQVEKILPLIDRESVIVAYGNMGAGGAELVKSIEQKQSKT